MGRVLVRHKMRPLVAPVIFLLVLGASVPMLQGATSARLTSKEGYAASTQGAFAFVSNFEDGELDGWSSVSGTIPTVSTSVTYSGENSLSSTAPQTDLANQEFVQDDSFISFQVAVDAGSGSGYFGLYSAAPPLTPVAVVGVSKGEVLAGTNTETLKTVGALPSGTAYPPGWVLLSANLYDASNSHNKTAGWVMQVYVDQTVAVNLTISAPQAADYAGAFIQTASGTVYYSDIVVSTYQVATTVPGYNNMEGYGQGSGLLIGLLPDFTTLSAQMDLSSWDTPQVGILSFQINAMNYRGTVSTAKSCDGFYQLGVDLNPDGYLAPWYVPGKNCVAHYFQGSQSPAVQEGVYTGPNTHLALSIVDDTAAKQMVFTIVVTSPALESPLTFSASRPYNGTEFYGTYTQMEFQPCCNQFPIQDYKLRGSLYDMQTAQPGKSPQNLPATYMLPFMLDAPTSWYLGYYQNSISGYQQTA